MAILSLDIPDEFISKALTYIPLHLSYQDEVPDEETGELIPNPESKVDRIKRELRDQLRIMYKAGKVTAAQTPLDQVRIEADEESEAITVS